MKQHLNHLLLNILECFSWLLFCHGKTQTSISPTARADGSCAGSSCGELMKLATKSGMDVILALSLYLTWIHNPFLNFLLFFFVMRLGFELRDLCPALLLGPCLQSILL
jgi:hypothetical protein